MQSLHLIAVVEARLVYCFRFHFEVLGCILLSCVFAITHAFQESIRTTPFFLNYGHPRTPTNAAFHLAPHKSDAGTTFLSGLHDALGSQALLADCSRAANEVCQQEAKGSQAWGERNCASWWKQPQAENGWCRQAYASPFTWLIMITYDGSPFLFFTFPFFTEDDRPWSSWLPWVLKTQYK